MLSQFERSSYVGNNDNETSDNLVVSNKVDEIVNDKKESDPTFNILTMSSNDLKSDNEKKSTKTRVLFCGTHPRLYSGYANVVYNLVKRLAGHDDLDITLWAFQNFKQNNVPRPEIPGITIYDAWANENSDTKKAGFGESLIGDWLKSNPQDLVIVYNDASVVCMLMQNIREKLSEEERGRTKFICYLDQVYRFQKERYIALINNMFDEVVTFTSHWRTVIKSQLRPDMPVSVLPHGFDCNIYYPIDKSICRIYFNVPSDAFVILTLNRCQPRKRLDHMCMVIADIVERHRDLIASKPGKVHRPIKLLVGTALTGSWDLPEILSWEFKRRGLKPELINEYIIAVSKPQQLSDKEINILYNSADCGIHCVDGEGMGLCALEHMGVGCPQVANNVGGFKEFMSPSNAILSEPICGYYSDASRDGIGGFGEMSDVGKVADGIWKLYQNPAIVKKLGKQARTDVLTHFKWDAIADRLYRIIVKSKKLAAKV